MKKIIFSLLFLVFLSACNSKVEESLDSPTSGTISVSVDETIAPVMRSEIDTFSKLYVDTKINASFIPQNEAFINLLNNKSRVIFAARPLNNDELKFYKKLEIVPHVEKICYDAVVLITNKANLDTNFTIEQVKSILNTSVNNWNELNNKNYSSPINVVFDNANSSTFSYLSNRLGITISKNLFALKDNKKVIEYVKNNKNAIGIIGLNWISDYDDQNTVNFIKDINIIGIKSDLPNTDPHMYYKPYQAYIALKQYPLFREIYAITSEARTGLGTGLMSFIAGEKGQRIFLKAGLVPATMPIRLIETYN